MQLWDLSSHTLLYQSGVITTSGLRSIDADPTLARFVIGCGDGDARVFEVTTPVSAVTTIAAEVTDITAQPT